MKTNRLISPFAHESRLFKRLKGKELNQVSEILFLIDYLILNLNSYKRSSLIMVRVDIIKLIKSRNPNLIIELQKYRLTINEIVFYG